jgi:hypothetical protein
MEGELFHPVGLVGVAVALGLVYWSAVRPRLAIARRLEGNPAAEAARLGWGHSTHDPFGVLGWHVGALRPGFRMRVRHTLWCERDGETVQLFQVEHWGYHTSVLRRYRIWFAALSAPAQPGALWLQGRRLAWGETLRGRHLGALEPELDWGAGHPVLEGRLPPQAAARFDVRGDAAAARALLTPALVEWLAGADDSLNLWLENGRLLVFRERFPVSELERLADAAAGARSALEGARVAQGTPEAAASLTTR